MAATRVEVIEALERMWDKYPEMRIGQLVTNVAIFARGPEDPQESVWDIGNDEFLATIRKHLGNG